MSRIVLLLCALFFINGCQEVKEPELTRQEKYIKNNPTLSEETKTHIKEGTVIVGMSEGEVRAAWGDPKGIEIFNSGENSYKRWIYDDGKPVFKLHSIFSTGKPIVEMLLLK